VKGFPPLTTEDIEQLDLLLKDVVTRSGALGALMVERAGYLIQRAGGELPGDAREFASLASNAFSAAQEMSRRLKENFFTHLRVTGTSYHTLIRHVDDSCLLVVVFDTRIAPEKVESEAVATVIGIFERLEIARQRAPGAFVDFADADAEDVTKFFRRTPPAE
jgi:predicted regulator of Ras-like GTPase activity (Roadblock/LC7/MglB family)